MRKYRNWILSLGIVAAPGLAVAGPFPFGHQRQSASESAAGQPSNQEMAENIARALRSSRLPGSNIDITVAGGVASLSGQIADEQSKAMATQLVGSVPGVVRVDNQLQVGAQSRPASGVHQAAFSRPSGQQDSEIQQVGLSLPPAPAPAPMSNKAVAQQIGAALAGANLTGYKIKIRFLQGYATLMGSVATLEEKMIADQVARHVPGVNAVDNQLEVLQAEAPLRQTAYQDDNAQAPPMGPPAGFPPGMPPGQPAMAPPGYPGGYPGTMPPGMPNPAYGNAVPGANPTIYNNPYLPQYAWPAQAQYPNSAAIQYPKQYAASLGLTSARSIPIRKYRWVGGKPRWNGTTATGCSTSIPKPTAGSGSSIRRTGKPDGQRSVT